MKIVGITACPTGIAHTYMAAEALTKAAQEMGHEIKIETQGVEVENILSDNDIQSADIVIIACQKTVDLSRFEGKRVTEVPIERAVKNPQKVIQDAIDGKNISIFELAKEDKAKKKAQQTGIYKHLMSGVNFMLPFVISGGILIAFSFMFGIKASDPNDPSFNVIAKALSDIGGGAAFGMMVPMLAAGIAYSIAGKQGMCSGMVAGVIAKSIGAGFLGGLIGAIFAGYLTKTLMEKIHLPKAIKTLKGLILVPLISVFITGMFMIFIVGEPVKFLLDGLTNYLNSMDSSNGVIFGLIIGAMMASDMGGPINKAISTFSIALMSTGVYVKILNKEVNIPLVLHGGSGNPDEEVTASVSLGVSKVNISSDVKSVFFKKCHELLNENPNQYEPCDLFPKCIDEAKKVIYHKLNVLNTIGKANLYK